MEIELCNQPYHTFRNDLTDRYVNHPTGDVTHPPRTYGPSFWAVLDPICKPSHGRRYSALFGVPKRFDI